MRKSGRERETWRPWKNREKFTVSNVIRTTHPSSEERVRKRGVGAFYFYSSRDGPGEKIKFKI